MRLSNRPKHNNMKVIGITGGIGAGKSVVTRIYQSMQVPVYDTDTMAKHLMDNSRAIHEQLCNCIHPRAVVDGIINRKLLATEVFGSSKKLSALNGIVHREVFNDLERWIIKQARAHEKAVVESALLYTASLDKLTDVVIEVKAPLELRIERVMQRNGLGRDEVLQRINSQAHEASLAVAHPHIVITNDGKASIMQQLHEQDLL